MPQHPPIRRAAELGFDIELRAISNVGGSVARHWHRDLQLIYTISGCGQAWVAGHCFPIPEERCCVIPPEAVHSAVSAGPDEWTFLSLHIDRDRIERTGSMPLIEAGASGAIDRAFGAIHRALFERSSDAGRHFHDLLAELANVQGACIRGASDPRLEAARLRLLSEPWDAQKTGVMAEHSGMERRSFERAFRKTFHMSPHAYRIISRIEWAKTRMRAGDGVTSACNAAGFGDHRHFSREFRKVTGITARSYAARFAKRVELLANRRGDWPITRLNVTRKALSEV